MMRGLNIIFKVISKVSILCIIISCNEQGNKQIAIYDSLEGKQRDFNLVIDKVNNTFENYYYEKGQLKKIYKLNFDKKSYLLIDGDDTCNFRLVNLKEFKVIKNHYTVFNFIAVTPPNRDDLRFFWNEKYGVLYTLGEGHKIFSKTVYRNSVESEIVENLISQILDDFCFHYNVNLNASDSLNLSLPPR